MSDYKMLASLRCVWRTPAALLLGHRENLKRLLLLSLYGQRIITIIIIIIIVVTDLLSALLSNGSINKPQQRNCFL
jgi:hypothetical protein